MLFVKRFLTATVLLATLFMVLYVGTLTVGRKLAASRAVDNLPVNFHTPNLEYEASERAGKGFERDYGSIIGLAALGVSAVGAVWLAFGGVLTWCQEDRAPQLPRNMRYGG